MTQVDRRGSLARRVLATVALLFMAAQAPQGAKAEEDVFTRFSVGKWYVGAGPAIGVSAFEGDAGGTGSPSAGVTLRIGQRSYDAFAWEIATDHFFKFVDGNAHPILLTANARWMIPSIFGEPGRWRPFLLAGSGWMQARQYRARQTRELDSAVIRLGTGIQFYQSVDTTWRLDAQYMIPVGDADDFQFGALLVTLEIF